MHAAVRDISKLPRHIHRLVVAVEHVQRAARRSGLALQPLQEEEQRQLLVAAVQQITHLATTEQGVEVGRGGEGLPGAVCLPASCTTSSACLHHGGRASRPPVLLVYEACQAEGAPRLAQVAVQVANGHQARNSGQHMRRRSLRRLRLPRSGRALRMQHVH